MALTLIRPMGLTWAFASYRPPRTATPRPWRVTRRLCNFVLAFAVIMFGSSVVSSSNCLVNHGLSRIFFHDVKRQALTLSRFGCTKEGIDIGSCADRYRLWRRLQTKSKDRTNCCKIPASKTLNRTRYTTPLPLTQSLGAINVEKLLDGGIFFDGPR